MSPVSFFACIRPSIHAPPRCPVVAFSSRRHRSGSQGCRHPCRSRCGNWAEVDLAFKDAETNALDLREISLLPARKRDRHPGGGRGIESVEPLGESFDSAFVDVTADLDHPKRMETDLLPLVKHVSFHLRHRRPLRTTRPAMRTAVICARWTTDHRHQNSARGKQRRPRHLF